MVKVKHIANNIIDTENFYLYLNNVNREYYNSSIPFKVMLYLVSLLTDKGLNDNNCIISTVYIERKLSISNINLFKGKFDYISSLTLTISQIKSTSCNTQIIPLYHIPCLKAVLRSYLVMSSN